MDRIEAYICLLSGEPVRNFRIPSYRGKEVVVAKEFENGDVRFFFIDEDGEDYDPLARAMINKSGYTTAPAVDKKLFDSIENW